MPRWGSPTQCLVGGRQLDASLGVANLMSRPTRRWGVAHLRVTRELSAVRPSARLQKVLSFFKKRSDSADAGDDWGPELGRAVLDHLAARKEEKKFPRESRAVGPNRSAAFPTDRATMAGRGCSARTERDRKRKKNAKMLKAKTKKNGRDHAGRHDELCAGPAARQFGVSSGVVRSSGSNEIR